MTAYISACFGLHSKLRKQKTCNTYFPPKRCPLLLISSFLPMAAAQLGRELLCPTIAMSSQHHLSLSSWLQRCSSGAIPTESKRMFSWRCSLYVTHGAMITTIAKFEMHWCGFQLRLGVYWSWFGISGVFCLFFLPEIINCSIKNS